MAMLINDYGQFIQLFNDQENKKRIKGIEATKVSI